MRPLALRLVLLGLSSCACADPEPGPAPLTIQLDERAVLVGDVTERLDGDDYVYLRLEIVRASSPARVRSRWVALEAGRALAPRPGQRVRVRSLARRTRVWAPGLERDFDVREYVALMWPL